MTGKPKNIVDKLIKEGVYQIYYTQTLTFEEKVVRVKHSSNF